ncbi:MAG: hypothetical protein ACM3MD_02610 [Betaproteobacteria bacterium]
MADAEQSKLEQAAAANGEQILALLHDPSPQVIRMLLGNRNLSEDDVLVIAARKNLPPDVLNMIAKDKRWAESYPVRLALAKNPKTPISVSLSIVRYLRLLDIAEISRSHLLPLAFRHKVEIIIVERIPTMPLGLKKSLAKMAGGNVLLKLLQDPDHEVIALCLNNPRLVESHLYKIISRKETISETIRIIAAHPNWSSRSLIRLALVRNDHTPLMHSGRFLQAMKLMELRELCADPSLSATIRPLVHRELGERGEDPEKRVEETIYEIDENDEAVVDEFTVTEGSQDADDREKEDTG